MDLSGHNLVYLIEFPPGGELGNNFLNGYNFKGSRFNQAILSFNNIKDANIEGADLSKLIFGYLVIKGSIDGFTILPESPFSFCHDDDSNDELHFCIYL